MNHAGISVLICIGVAGLAGCASKPEAVCKTESRYISIITEPSGAAVQQVNPTGLPVINLGETPIREQPVVVVTDIIKMKNLPPAESMSMMRRSNGEVLVVIRKEGYEKFTGYLKTERDKTMVHTITLSPLK